MKVYNVEVLFTAEKKMQVLAKNEEEAKAKVRNIYTTTNLLDVHPWSMVLEDPLVYEADDIETIQAAVTESGEPADESAASDGEQTAPAASEGDAEVFEYGTPYDFTRMERKVRMEEAGFPTAFRSYPLDGRLRLSTDAADFFSPEGSVGTMASKRLGGIVLHDILASVRAPKDLRGAVDAAVRGVFDTDGSEHRPDRVVALPDRTIIIDYKTGEQDKGYTRQLQRYIRLYRQMGYPAVSGHIWYLHDGVVVDI